MRCPRVSLPALRQAPGFTLIELLVVVAIILVLTAILFPVFAKVRGKAYQASCTSNVKQLCLAAQMYASDWDGRLFANYEPNNEQGNDPDIQGNYRWHSLHYYRSYFRSQGLVNCPSLGPGLISYGQNVGLGWGGYSPRIDLEASRAYPLNPYRKAPSDMVLFAEADDVWIWDYRFADGASSLFPKLRCHHSGGTVFGFFDAHAKWHRFDSINVLQFGGPPPGAGPDAFQR
ncbi:MAG: type II secretion system protein, partial [Armatimonadota bacterium]